MSKVLLVFFLFRLFFEFVRTNLHLNAHFHNYQRDKLISLLETIELGINAITLMFILLSAVLLAIWLHRSYSNFNKFQFNPLRQNASMAFLAWFIPISNSRIIYGMLTEVSTGFYQIAEKNNVAKFNSRNLSVMNWSWFLMGTGFLFFSIGIFSVSLISAIVMIVSSAFFIIAIVLWILYFRKFSVVEEKVEKLEGVHLITSTSEEILDN